MAELSAELDVDAVLGDDGVIQQYIPGFQPRASQLAMAELIQESIDSNRRQVIEASTGIGKSFAYLVPAFLADVKIVISTGTKNLQDQLFNKDIPLINKTIVSGKKLALLKGRSNYCCIHRLDKYRQQRRFQTRQLAPLFDALKQWSLATRSGDIAEFAELPEQDSLWFYATSTADNCLGGDCPDFADCFVVKARRKAQEADVIVINHHLFFSDQALKDEGFGELLPRVDVLIFDEAHQLPDVASNFYSRMLSKRQLDMLLRDTVEAQLSEARESGEIQELCQRLQKAVDDFRLAIGRFPERGEWRNIQHAPTVAEGIAQVSDSLQRLAQDLDAIKARGKDLASCCQRLQVMQAVLNDFQQPDDKLVSWYEWNERSFRLMLSPVEITDQFRRQLDSNDYRSVIFTSATLSSNRSFDYFTHRLGLEDIACARFDSPFDYRRQAMLYLPENLPEPASDGFAAEFASLCAQLIGATQGNAFILFTSYRMLTQTADRLERSLNNPLFVQGRKQRSELLRDYLATPGGVLLGASSFWEGVDVKGDRLKLVIIDKLPFKSPADPVYRQRLQHANRAGGNAFTDIQIPETTLALRQGVGRLIRDVHDRGIVMIADNRIQSKAYGEQMRNSLPDMQVTSNLGEVLEFARTL